MAANVESLTPFYRGWDRYQGLLVDAIAPLTDEQLAFQASPSHWPVWFLGAHVVSARVYWFHRVLGEGETELRPLTTWDKDGAPVRSAPELIEGLHASWQLIADTLDRLTPADLNAQFTTRHGNTYSRQRIIWHVIEHDLHHGGEIFLTLGMHGVPTPEL